MNKRILPVRRSPLSLAVALAFAGTTLGAQAQSLPTGGQVTAGAGSVSQPSATAMVVTQTTDKLAMTWQSFSIGAGHSVQFDQPSASSIALNRVIGGSRSEIYGSLSANGQVFLVNPNGILFGRGAQVDVGGLVASTLNISDRDFLDGKYLFSDPSNRAAVVNEGNLSGRYLAFIGNQTINRGTMQAQRGAVALGAGGTVELTLADNRLLKFQVTEGALNALAENGGLIRADGGRVILTAGARDSLLASAVNNTGVIEARTVERQAGNILLLAGMEAGTTRVGGTLDASAPNGGDGGFIETSASQVKVADDARITTKAASGKSGKWLIDPKNYTIGTDITGLALSSALAASNVEIQSSGGGAGTGGDINVDEAVSWSVNELTLTAARDININAVMTASGTSSLVMNTATANGGDAGVPGGTVKVGMNADHSFKGRVEFDRSGIGFLTINGAGYTVINSLGAQGSTTGLDLQGMAGNGAGHYALGRDIDASDTSGWNTGAGFAPVGFAGTFDGLGHTITGLTINRPSATQVGLFGSSSDATLRNVDLAGGSVVGALEVGGLVGRADTSMIHNVRSGVAVTGTTVGGLVGRLVQSFVTDSHATGVVTGAGARREIGGLVGYNEGGSLANVSASGDINSGGASTGGLVGYNLGGSITDARASGNVTFGTSGVGGLVGRNDGGSIADSVATGSVTTADAGVDVGGLVGSSLNAGASIVGSHAEGNVAGRQNVGGLVGQNSGVLDTVYAKGNVTGVVDATPTSAFGGLAGRNTGTVTDAHALGNVTYAGGSTNFASGVGGLIGINSGAVSGSYASGNVTVSGTNVSSTPSENVGGLIGENHGALTTVQAHGTVSNTGIRTGGLAGFNTAVISQATVDGPSVTGAGDYAGGLVGRNEAAISDSAAYADVTSQGNLVGGLVGYSINGNLSYVTAEGAVLGNGGASTMVGGLIGQLDSGSLDNGQAVGPVTGQRQVGGLIGLLGGNPANGQNVTHSHATGSVTALAVSTFSNAGGLIGEASTFTGVIQDVYANGNVTSAGDSVGGLIGRHTDGSVIDAVARGRVQGRSSVGGLIGFSSSTIDNSHAEGAVVATNFAGISNAGGLVGNNLSDLHNVYAIGAVQGTGSQVGGLLGVNLGAVTNVYATGTVSGVGSVGGLIGSNTGTVTQSYYDTGTVTGTGSNTGGLIGSNSADLINANVHAGGAVSGVDFVGGLIGNNTGNVSDAYATGAVTATVGTAGGLIGYHVNNSSTIPQTITRVHATGAVTGGGGLGGLLGDVAGLVTVSDSYAIGPVSATGGTVGGLIGRISTGVVVTRVYATGAVTGNSVVGGLVGTNDGVIQDAYATGAVSAGANAPRVGGVVGRNDDDGLVQRVYAAAPVDNNNSITPPAGNTTGGLIGENVAGGLVFDSYWDGDKRLDQRFDIGATAGNGSTGGRLGGGAEKTQSSYAGWDFAGTWVIYEGFTYPLLRSFLTPITVTVGNAAKTYDAMAFSGGPGVTYSGLPPATNPDPSKLLGDLGYAGTSQGAINAGTYNIRATGLYSHQQGYLITLVDGTLNVAKAPLTLSTTDVTKTYDGNRTAAGTLVAVGGTQLFGTDSLGSGATFEFDTKNAGNGNKRVAVSGATVNDGNSGGNYIVSYADNTTSTIDRAALTLAAAAESRTYNGSDSSSGTVAASGLVGGDTVTSATQRFDSRHAGSRVLSVDSYTINDGNNGNNYVVSTATASGTITQAALTLAASSESRTYNGSDSSSGTVAASGLVGSDTVTSATQRFDSRHAGSRTLSVDAYTINDGNNGNNYVVSTATAGGTIAQAALTLAAVSETRAYNGSDSSGGTVAASGLVGSDTVTSATQRFDSRNAGSRTLSVNGYTINDGNSGNNYAVGTTTASGTITQAVLTVTADNLGKPVGTTYSFAGTEFSATGLVAGETIGSALLSSPGAASSAVAGPYTITASGVSGGSFSASNYSVSYVNGSMTVLAAPPPPAPAPAQSVAVEPPVSVPMLGNLEAIRAAIIEAQKIDPQRSAPTEGSRALNVVVIGAGINLPQGVE